MHTKTFLTVVAATLALAFAAQVASANRLSVSETRFRAVWRDLQFDSNGIIINCPITIEGSFHSATFKKTAGALIGHISRASVFGALGMGACTGGEATIFQESLPWHLVYISFAGTLPRPSSIKVKLVNSRFRVNPLGPLIPACTFTSFEEDPVKGDFLIEPNGLVTGIRADERAEIAGECLGLPIAHLSRTASLTRLGSTGNISIRLI